MGSPSSTASCAPGDKNGGAGPNFTWAGVNAFCGFPDWVNAIATVNRKIQIANLFIIVILLRKTVVLQCEIGIALFEPPSTPRSLRKIKKASLLRLENFPS